MSTPTVEQIIVHCARHFGVTYDNIILKNRKKQIMFARHSCWWFIKREYPELSLAAIGRILGGRHYSTGICSLKEVQDLLDTNRVFSKSFNELVVKIDANKLIEDSSLNDLAYEEILS